MGDTSITNKSITENQRRDETVHILSVGLDKCEVSTKKLQNYVHIPTKDRQAQQNT